MESAYKQIWKRVKIKNCKMWIIKRSQENSKLSLKYRVVKDVCKVYVRLSSIN